MTYYTLLQQLLHLILKMLKVEALNPCCKWRWGRESKWKNVNEPTSHQDINTEMDSLGKSNLEYEERKQTRKEKKNVTLTNDNWCITLLWGSLCSQQGSWDRWRPIWANPQLKGAINQSLSVFMGMGCEASISLSVTVKTISKLTKSQKKATALC